MCSPRSPALLLILFLSLAGTATATYGGDNPLNSTYFGDISGGYLFNMGSSRYEGSVLPGDTYNVTYSFDLPQDARVKFQRLYLYWSWSRIGQKAVYPGFVVYDSRQPGVPLPRAVRYSDSKGFVSQYDFYSGVDVYEMPALSPGRNAFTVTCVQAGLPNSSVIIFGMGALAVYEHGGFDAYTGPVERSPHANETVDLYASVATLPPTEPTKSPLPPFLPVCAAAAMFLVAARRNWQ